MNKIDNSGAGIAALGRNGDKFMAHVAAGEMVVPPVITPETRARLFQEMQQAGLDPDRYTVGEGMSINPITGLPEFFFKKVFKGVKKIAKKALPVVAGLAIPGIGNVIGGGLSSLGSALGIPSGIGSSLLGGKGAGLLDTMSGIRGGIGGFFGGTGAGGPQQGLGSIFGGGGQYTVKSGDTLSQIAAANNTTVAELAKLNNIANPNMIMAGQTLTLPKSGGGLGGFLGNIFGGGATTPGTNQGGLGSFLGNIGGGGVLDTVLKGVLAKRLLDQDSPNPADIIPMGLNAFGYTPDMIEALKNDSYRIGNLKPALIQGQQYANLDPENMPTSTPIATAEAGGIMGLEAGTMVNPNRMDDNGPGDITPAFLEPGEFVMTRPATQVLGARNLYKLMKDAERMA